MGLFTRKPEIAELAAQRDFEELAHLARKSKTSDEAIAALMELRDPAMVAPIVKVWHQLRTSKAEQEKLLGVLRAIGPEAVTAELAGIGDVESLFVLARLRGEEAVPVLRELAFPTDPRTEPRPAAAFYAAFEIEGPAARRLVYDGLADEATHRSALAAVARSWDDDDPVLLEIVVRVSPDGDPDALRALERWGKGVASGKLPGDRGIAKLVELLADESPEVQAMAIDGLRLTLGDGRTEPDPRMADALFRLAEAESANPVVRGHAAGGLIAQSDPRSGAAGMSALEALVAAAHWDPAAKLAVALREHRAADEMPNAVERLRALEGGQRVPSKELRAALKWLRIKLEGKAKERARAGAPTS